MFSRLLSVSARSLTTRFPYISFSNRCAGQKDKLSFSCALPSETHTLALGASILDAFGVEAGDVIYLLGALSSGKTVVARGYLQALADDSSLEVSSPTFVVDRSYKFELPFESSFGTEWKPLNVHHMDMYRLANDPQDVFTYTRMFTEDVCLIEWPEFLAVKAESRLEVQLSKTHDDSVRIVCVNPVGERWASCWQEATSMMQKKLYGEH